MGTKKRIDPVKVDYIEVWAYLMGAYLVYEIGDKEFRIKFQSEIEDWLTYQDQKRFGELIKKVIRSEMNEFQITKEEIKKLVQKLYTEPKWKVTIVEPVTYRLRLQQLLDTY